MYLSVVIFEVATLTNARMSSADVSNRSVASAMLFFRGMVFSPPENRSVQARAGSAVAFETPTLGSTSLRRHSSAIGRS
jgi:hypothetical protein